MITTLARLILATVIILAIYYLLTKLRPKPSYFVVPLDYPRHDMLGEVDVGDYLDLWPSPNGNSIYVYKKGDSEGEEVLGQLPAKYFSVVETVLRKGQLYEARVQEHNESNLRVEVKLRVKRLNDYV